MNKDKEEIENPNFYNFFDIIGNKILTIPFRKTISIQLSKEIIDILTDRDRDTDQ